MSDEELDLSYELLEVIRAKVGEVGLRRFIKDFSDYCEAILSVSSDEEYVEVNDSLSESTEASDDSEIPSVEVEEEYTTEVDNEGFLSLKECEVVNQK